MTINSSGGLSHSAPVATVSVVGTGSVAVVPDAARLRVAASASAPTVAGASEALAVAVGRLFDVAKEVVDARRVVSSGLQVWPRHDNDGRMMGAEASQQVTVLCPALDVASALVSRLAETVGDGLRVDGLDLEVSDPSQAVLEARENAFVDARERAEHLAALSGRELGEVLTVVEGDGGGSPFPAGARMALAAMPVEAGERQVTASLRVTWLLV
ncbi:SIMPL domain-containing protein [Nocardioides yefusunii]|uniref:SIMPL domain-containing protein n=1 Tax=Nocardioides yefusunii TaxID=2500546 RepID=A0ABW1QZQ5_9ACTN|nr:SIMPL domain-containing protein [Nocardioides yefusunii]